jgi:hypothetical protein
MTSEGNVENRWEEQTGSFTVQDDTGVEFTVHVFTTFRETTDLSGYQKVANALKNLKGTDGRHVNPIEGQETKFAFVDEPDRIFTVVDVDEYRRAVS